MASTSEITFGDCWNFPAMQTVTQAGGAHVSDVALLSFAKPRRYQLKELAQIPLLPWENAVGLRLGDLQLEDGDLLLFKDCSQPERVPLEQLREQGIIVTNAPLKGDGTSGGRALEPSIVIRTSFHRENGTSGKTKKVPNEGELQQQQQQQQPQAKAPAFTAEKTLSDTPAPPPAPPLPF
jgi:hypothetical protein